MNPNLGSSSYKQQIKYAADMYYKNMYATCEDEKYNIDADELQNRWRLTYATSRKFVEVQVVCGRRDDFSWSDLDSDSMKVFMLMIEDYIVVMLGDLGLPLYRCMDNWGARILLIALIRNTMPRNDKDDVSIFILSSIGHIF